MRVNGEWRKKAICATVLTQSSQEGFTVDNLRSRFAPATLVAVLFAGIVTFAETAATQEITVAGRVDKVFERWNTRASPGCAVAIGQNGRVVLKRAYGVANLEDGTPIRTDTIFEAGSVSKQFTASAIALLVQEGKVSLDDPVRKYLPEVPDFGTPILIRHLLTHTSGLRSQWPLLILAGRPPGRVVHTIGEILDLVSRQKRLNFPPGEEFLYNNTAFTLLGVVVQRVSGQTFQAFSEARLFKPLGMTHTAWRIDHTVVVKGRAAAYAPGPDGAFHTEMPFTDVVGNGGLLTTVEDLFLWNENLDGPRVGGRGMAEFLQTRGTLNDGFVTRYGRGLYVGEYRGLREVYHGGSTAGYRAFVTRFPDHRLSISILCNAGNAPERLGHQVADIFLEGEFKDVPPKAAAALPVDQLKSKAGLFRNPNTDAVLRVDFDGRTLRVGDSELVAIDPNHFRNTAGDVEFMFEAPGSGGLLRLHVTSSSAKPTSWVAAPVASPTPAELADYAGTYYSDELDVKYDVWVNDTRLALRHRPEPAVALGPAYADAFDFGEGRVIRFTRDQAAKVDGLEIFAGRVRHLRFERLATVAAGTGR
jgi:CubicO group peptidase (beta-lactamase class C family)